MSVEIIEQRLKAYHSKTRLDEINALKEITQEIALMALSKADFFKLAEFHGGTALRILYGMNRFSEDLDFALSRKVLIKSLLPVVELEITFFINKTRNSCGITWIFCASSVPKLTLWPLK